MGRSQAFHGRACYRSLRGKLPSLRSAATLTANNTRWYAIFVIRTQISLSEADYQAAKTEAARLGISLSELLRRALLGVLSKDQSKPWMRYAGMVESGDPRSSARVDEGVYGAEC